MKVWLVLRWGIYVQGIIGIYSSEQLAKEAAQRAKALEPDDYHSFEVTECAVDSDLLPDREGDEIFN